MITFVVAGDKGGVGKSLLSCLLTEWLLYNDRIVQLIDADPNGTTADWMKACAEEGRQVSSSRNGDYRIIDTGGRVGSGLAYLKEADLILAPFQPLSADVSRAITWFLSLGPQFQEKVVFIPNRIRSPLITLEQRAGIGQIEKLIQKVGKGLLVVGLTDRVAVYPMLFDGSAVNFFEVEKGGSYRKALEEADEVFREILKVSESKVDA